MVSIIIPVYNTARFLHEALDSVVAQTCNDWECICVDDGSSDGSGDIVSSYVARDRRFVLIRQENAGQSVARNNALKLARGEYIYMMDSDDVLEATLLEEALARARETAADVVFFNASVIGGKAWCDYSMACGWPAGVMDGQGALRLAMSRCSYRCCVWLMLVKAPVSMGFYPGIIHEDELFTASLYASSRRVAALDRSLVRHRVHSASTMQRAFGLRNVDSYIVVCHELMTARVPVLHDMACYIIPVIFRTAGSVPMRDKPAAFMRMARAGWLPHVPLRYLLSFWKPRF